MAVPNFPVFDTSPGANQGLFKLTLWQRIVYSFRIRAFKYMIPEPPYQPSFFISRKSWERLIRGENVINKYPGYEVYGFVFCVAFEGDEKCKEGEKRHKKNKKKTGKAYFRVRTILRKKDDQPTSGNITVEVEPVNIAYASVDYALGARPDGQYDDLVFLVNNPDLAAEIDSEVIVKHDSGTATPANNANIPDSFKDRCGSFINNEGHIFSKDRIEGILKDYSRAKGSRVYLVWNGPDQSISFKFKVNPDYGTEIPCPQPNICT